MALLALFLNVSLPACNLHKLMAPPDRSSIRDLENLSMHTSASLISSAFFLRSEGLFASFLGSTSRNHHGLMQRPLAFSLPVLSYLRYAP